MKKIEDKFIPYDLAQRLKTLGFDDPCMTYHFIGGKLSKYYKNAHRNSGLIQQKPYKFHCTAILWQDAMDWFLEKHELLSQISRIKNGNYHGIIQSVSEEYIEHMRLLGSICIDEVVDVYSYKEARLETLEKLIEYVENQQTNIEE